MHVIWTNNFADSVCCVLSMGILLLFTISEIQAEEDRKQHRNLHFYQLYRHFSLFYFLFFLKFSLISFHLWHTYIDCELNFSRDIANIVTIYQKKGIFP